MICKISRFFSSLHSYIKALFVYKEISNQIFNGATIDARREAGARKSSSLSGLLACYLRFYTERTLYIKSQNAKKDTTNNGNSDYASALETRCPVL